MSIVINGYTLPNVAQGKVYRKTYDGELNTLIVTYKDTIEPTYKPYDIAFVDGKEWLVAIIDFNLLSRLPQFKNYKIILTLVELTKLLERVVVSPCTFTNKDDTLYKQIIKALYKAEPLLVGETPRFDISGLVSLTSSVPGEDFIFESKMTLREILDAMLSVVNARVVVSSVTNDFSKLYISYLDLARQSEDIKSIPNVISMRSTHNIEYLTSEYDTSVRNAQSKKERVICDGWTTLKPSSLGLSDTNGLRLTTSNPIDRITQCLYRIEIGLTFNSGNAEIKDFTVDISHLFVEQELYDVMDITEQEKHIPYTRGSKDVGAYESYKKLFITKDKLKAEVNPLLQNEANEYAASINDAISNVSFPLPEDYYYKSLFKIAYIPYLDLNYKQSKDNYESQFKSTMVSNQTDGVVDIDRYAKSLRVLANKSGNKELEIDSRVNSVDDLLQLGDRITDDYTLVSKEYSVFDYHVKVHYTFIQNYSNVITAKLSRERRLYNIPIEGIIDRDILLKDYLIVSATQNVINDGCLSGDAVKYFLKTFDNTNDRDDPIDRLLLWTKDKSSKYYGLFSLDFIGSAIGKSMHWQVRMYDNYSVGLSTGSRMIGGRLVYQNPYVDSNGECESMIIKIIKTNIDNISFNDQLEIGNSMPVVPLDLQEKYIKKVYGYKDYCVKKDAREKLGISYQLEAKSKDDNIIIGDYFTHYSNLLYGKNITPFYIWVSYDQTYRLTDTAKCKGTIIQASPKIDINNYRLYTDATQIQTVKSWAISDNKGNLLIAFNNPEGGYIDGCYFTISSG